jgi:amino acid adenylation domain-containing protein
MSDSGSGGLGRRLATLSPQEKARLLGLLREKKKASSPEEGIPLRDRAADPPPLSFAQQRLWFLDRLRPRDPVFNIPSPLRIDGPLDVAALRRALEGVAGRHESLRTTFALAEEGPVQVIAPRVDVDLPVVDLAGLAAEVAEAEVARLSGEENLRPFDLATGPLLRATLLRRGGSRHVLLLTLHHIVSDGWSTSVLVRDLTAFYGGGALPPLSIQYADFAVWQRHQLAGAELERRLAVWRKRLAGAPAALELPADRPRTGPRSGPRTSRGGARRFRLEAPLALSLRELARERGGTPFMVLLAAYQTLLHRLADRDDLCVAVPVANRERTEVAGLIGFFVNTLVMRGDLSGDPPFSGLVERTGAVALEAFSHQDLPFEKLVEELRPERDAGRSPLAQVSLVLQNHPLAAAPVGDLRIEALPVEVRTVKLDLTLTLEEDAEGFGAWLQYSTDLFDAATARRMAEAFVTLTAAACADPAARLSELPLLSMAEQAQVLEWSGSVAPPVPIPDPALVHERFARRAALHPEQPALVWDEGEWTWGELARRVGGMARRLRSIGVGPEVRVAMVAERTPEVIAGMLAVLSAGGVWVPLDPRLPPARRAELLERAGARLLDPADLDLINPPKSGENLPEVPPECAAYVIFTSGSTGEPKGVVVEHRQLQHYVDAVSTRLRLPEGASWALVSTLAADLGHTALFPALCTGGQLHLISPERALDPEAFAAYTESHRIDALKIVPSHLSALLSGSRPAAVLPRELLVLGGEATSWELAERIAELAPGLRVLNHYGPTETTVGVVAGPIRSDQIGISSRPRPRRPPLGRPLPNVEAWVLDRRQRLALTGVPGELFFGGDGVARGDLGQPDRTAERFVPHPFAAVPGARLYRTGDLARWLPDGTLEFLGRVDDQVKIRGFRVEPGEVEAVLGRHPDVRGCTVLVREGPGGPTLAAYVAVQGAILEEGPKGLRAWLAERLPGHMVPAGWSLLEALPLTPNGKVDRQALARIEPVSRREREGIPPRTALEREIAAIWSDVLGVETAAADQSFFDLGGHSLLLPRVQQELRERLGFNLALIEMFTHPTVAALAAWLEKGEAVLVAEEDSSDRARRQRQGLEMQRQRLARRRSA